MATLPGNAGGPQPVQEQCVVTCTYEVDVDSIRDQRKTDARATPWYDPEARGDDATYSIAIYDPLCKVEDCPGTSVRRSNGSNVHAKLISGLNGLAVPRDISALLHKLEQFQDTEDIRRHILNRFVIFKGVNTAHFTYNSEFGGTNADLARSMNITGVCQQPVRLGQSFGIGDPVRFVVPVKEDLNKSNFFTRYDGRRHQRGKIMMYLSRVDARRTYKLMRSTLRDFLHDPQGIKTILQHSSDAEKKLMPAFAMPEYFQRVLHTAMLLGQYLGIRAGVLEVRRPQTGAGGVYRASLEERGPEQAGFGHYNFSDALHYVENAAGAAAFPTPGATPGANVRVFGNVGGGGGEDDAAYEYLILALQMANLTLKQDPPISPEEGAYGSEGFFSVARDPNNVQERAAGRLRALLDVGCRNMAANMYTHEDYAQNVVGYDPTTGINRRVFKVERDGYVDKNRDAGVAACAVSQSLQSYLQVVASAAHEMTQSHGVVVAGGKEVVNVFIGRAAV